MTPRTLPWLLLTTAVAYSIYVTVSRPEAHQQVDCPPCAGPADPETPLCAPTVPTDPPHPLPGPAAAPTATALPEPPPDVEAAVKTPPQPSSAPARGTCEPTLATCRKLPEVRQIEEKLDAALAWDDTVTEAMRAASRRSARRATLDTLLAESFDISEADVAYLEETACALRELRWHAVGLLHEDGAAGDDAASLIRSDRRDILADLELRLGKERYERFRSLGGIGLLNDTLHCADRDL